MTKIGFIITALLSSVVVIMLHRGYNFSQPKLLDTTPVSEEYIQNEDPFDRKNLTILEMTVSEPKLNKQQSREVLILPNSICPDLISGNNKAIKIGKAVTRWEVVNLKSYDFTSPKFDCEDFRTKQEYIMTSSEEELDFPLAFSIVLYKDVAQFEKLLRAIYRPHNYYSIHVDAKADPSIHRAVKLISQCLDHVVVITRPVAVTWGRFTVLEADLLCMRELLKHGHWKYFINLTGQEYPLKTNLEIVKILKIFRGANNVDASPRYR